MVFEPKYKIKIPEKYKNVKYTVHNDHLLLSLLYLTSLFLRPNSFAISSSADKKFFFLIIGMNLLAHINTPGNKSKSGKKFSFLIEK